MKFGVGGFLVLASYLSVVRADSCDSVSNGYECSPEISHYWGAHAPYFKVASDIPTMVPCGCDVTFAQMLGRHGARYPTSSKTAEYNATVAGIHSSVTSYGPGYEFIKDYEYTLGADELTVFGQQQLVNGGIKFYERYQKLAKINTPFFRSSGDSRVVESAQNFTQGFHQARHSANSSAADDYPYNILTIPGDAGVNSTLDHELCTAFESGSDSTISDSAQATYLSVFGPSIMARLNANLPGANLTLTQTIDVMELCPFNTVASANGTISPWCSLFTADEWKSFAYYHSLGKYYGYGFGNPLGPTQGVGFTNELIARLTNTSVKDHTSTNATLDSSAATFPLGLPLYADFSHDNDMTGIFSAMGLYNATAPLSNTTRETTNETHGYSASWTVPFAARMYVEKMTCGGHDSELVRIIVNDRVIPLQNCGADALGRCTLDSFIESLSFAKNGGHWDQCFV